MMKRQSLLMILISFITISTSAQIQNIKLENGQLYFEKVYEVDSLSSLNMEQFLIYNISKLNYITDFSVNNYIITSKIKGVVINYREYGAKWGSTPVYMNHPFFCDIKIIWKERKYRVTATNMVFNVPGFGTTQLSLLATKKNGTEFRENQLAALSIIEQFLSEFFTIKKTQNDEW